MEYFTTIMSVTKKLKDCSAGDIISFPTESNFPLLLARTNEEHSKFVLLYLSKSDGTDAPPIATKQFGPMLHENVGITAEKYKDTVVTVLGNIAQELYEIEQECIQHASK